jgi:hypothetical protein
MTPEKDKIFEIEDFNKVFEAGKQEEPIEAPKVKKEPVKQEAETENEAENTENVEEGQEEVIEEQENQQEETHEETEEEAENRALSEQEEEAQEAKINKENKTSNSHRDTKAEKQIAKLVRERERLKGQLDAVRNQSQRQQSGNQEVFIDLDAPNPLNYANGENDIDFRVDAKLYQRDKQKRIDSFKTVKEEIVKKYPDTIELMEMDAERANSGITTVNPTIVKLIYDSPVSGELWHYLLANSDETLKIAKMDPIKTALAIGRIEAKLETDNKEPKETKENKTAPKKVLPTPPNPVKSTKQNTTASVKNFGFTSY